MRLRVVCHRDRKKFHRREEIKKIPRQITLKAGMHGEMEVVAFVPIERYPIVIVLISE